MPAGVLATIYHAADDAGMLNVRRRRSRKEEP